MRAHGVLVSEPRSPAYIGGLTEIRRLVENQPGELYERNHRRVFQRWSGSKRHVADPTPARLTSAGPFSQLVVSWYSVFFLHQL